MTQSWATNRQAINIATKEKAKNAIAKNPRLAGAMSKLFKQHKRRITFNKFPSTMIYPYRQWCDPASQSHRELSSAIVDTMYGFQFTLAMIDQEATFQALYDSYRIMSVEVTFSPRAVILADIVSGQGSSGQYNRYILAAVDLDDSNAPTTLQEVREYGNCKRIEFVQGRPYKMTFTPAVAQEVFLTALTTSYAQRKHQWLDLASSAVPHFGLKVAMPATPIATQNVIDVHVRYLLEFKAVR